MRDDRDPVDALLSPWWTRIAQNIHGCQSYCIGLFSNDGTVLYINSALKRLVGTSVTESFANPGFADLLTSASTRAANTSGQTQVFDGFITLTNGSTDTSILARGYTENGQLLILGEVDVASLSNQYDSIVKLNREVNQLQRDLLQRKRDLQREIEERKTSQARVQALLQEKEMILREVHHRIKNNMNVVAGLLRLQDATHDDPRTRTILQDAAHRVQSMMLLYEKLYHSSDVTTITLDGYFVPLLRQIVDIFPLGNRVTLRTDIESIPCSPEFISSLGIIINELATNAMKHAFPEIDQPTGITAPGTATISLTALRNDDLLELEFSDNGLGLPESIAFESHEGFGMQLITMLVKQLRGTITVTRDHGTRVVIKCPVPV